MQLAVWLLAVCSNVVCCWDPQCPTLPSNGCILSDLWAPCGQPASSHMQRTLPYAVHLCSQMQPTGSQMYPCRCPISARMLPCGQPNSTICNVCCNMLHMPPFCSQMQPTGSQIHPPGAKYQPLGSPVANQPAATQTPNSTRNAVMLQCSYGRKIMGAGGRGVSL